MKRIIEVSLGVLGVVGAFLGLFILFAGEDQYLGYGGSTWRVGDIPDAWAYGFLTVGIVLLALASVLVIRDLRH